MITIDERLAILDGWLRQTYPDMGWEFSPGIIRGRFNGSIIEIVEADDAHYRRALCGGMYCDSSYIEGVQNMLCEVRCRSRLRLGNVEKFEIGVV